MLEWFMVLAVVLTFSTISFAVAWTREKVQRMDAEARLLAHRVVIEEWRREIEGDTTHLGRGRHGWGWRLMAVVSDEKLEALKVDYLRGYRDALALSLSNESLACMDEEAQIERIGIVRGLGMALRHLGFADDLDGEREDA